MKKLELEYKNDATIGKKGMRLYCQDCGTDKMNIVQVGWATYAVCTKCTKFVLIHDG